MEERGIALRLPDKSENWLLLIVSQQFRIKVRELGGALPQHQMPS
jgi:hypothetical protein